jgi:hypothetical protein
MLLELEQQTWLGPARVLRAAGNRVQIELPDEIAWASVAVACPYQAAVGDSVLAIGQRGSWYVIGVLEGTGKTIIKVPGDLAILAPAGKIEIKSGREVRIKSPAVRIVAGKLEAMARSIFERFAQATRWVKETFQLRSGRYRARVEGTYDVQADRIVERAEDDVIIDGREIKLG